MRTVLALVMVALFAVTCVTSADAQTKEQDVINKYLASKEKVHKTHLTWMSGNLMVNRINRHNDYNKFASYNSGHLSDGSLSWLSQAKTFGLDLGVIVSDRIALSINTEYWLTLGESQSGSFSYTPPTSAAATVEELVSEVSVWGVSLAAQYYFFNHPTITDGLTGLALRAGGSIGYYQANWDLWSEYQNLNLSTASYASTSENTTYRGSAPGLSMFFGADYPLGFLDLGMGADFGYLYLNFKNVAWYNEADDEIVAVYADNGARVNLGLSGFRGKVEIKKFFAW